MISEDFDSFGIAVGSRPSFAASAEFEPSTRTVGEAWFTTMVAEGRHDQYSVVEPIRHEEHRASWNSAGHKGAIRMP